MLEIKTSWAKRNECNPPPLW